MVAIHGARVHLEQLARMLDALAHRGPDGRGMYARDEAGLGHVRLSVVDIEGGHQPMSIGHGRYWITFNGELFNYPELREELIRRGHRFATQSDTEVILHLYQEKGEDCVQELNGQWAFAIWDAWRHRLFLSRDRMGVRPLFYTQTAEGLHFASEIKALRACPQVGGELDLQALDQIFTYWVTLPPRTAFRGIQQLPPGHSLIYEDGRVRTWEYWKLEYAPAGERSDAGEKKRAEELLALLEDATRIRLRADVAVGAYLSGGLDSTFLASLAQSCAGRRLLTFSVTFDDEAFDESRYQREASAYLGTDHTELHCTSEDIARVFPLVVWHAEQPILRTAPAPLFLLSQLVRRSGFKVVLTGEGADEALGGYDIFKETKIRQFWARNPASEWRPLLLRRLYPYLEGIQKQPMSYLKTFFHVGEGQLENLYFSHQPRWQLTARLKMLLSEEARMELRAHPGTAELDAQMPQDFARWDPFNRAEYLEARYLLPGYILSSQGDRMAMAHAVEGRYPFLDHRVMEYAAKLPPSSKMQGLDEKHLLKRAALGRVPESIRKRYKQPYRAPEGKGLLENARYAQKLLSRASISSRGVFSVQAVDALVARFRAGHAWTTRDNMALVGVLSTQILLDSCMNRDAAFPERLAPGKATVAMGALQDAEARHADG